MSVSRVGEHTVVAGGIRARVLEEGSGSPILLLHGGALGSSADVWERNFGPLAARGLRAIAVDLPGNGGTEAPPEPTEAYRRRFLLELLDALEIEHVGVVGHSSAGGLTLSLGFERPDRVSRIMILGTHSLLPPLPEGEEAAEPTGEGGRAASEPTIDDVRAVLEEQLFDHALITSEVLEARLRIGAMRTRPAARVSGGAGDRQAERQVLWQRLDQLPVPLLMMYGSDDQPTTPRRLALLRERYPSLDVRIVDRCAHLIQWDAAAQFEAAAGAFFGA